ncbi:hypothetical protein KM043_006524 [Ampulex compressa]|nr:hypothetical protein KM043_006524 [Ampulex compressa]
MNYLWARITGNQRRRVCEKFPQIETPLQIGPADPPALLDRGSGNVPRQGSGEEVGIARGRTVTNKGPISARLSGENIRLNALRMAEPGIRLRGIPRIRIIPKTGQFVGLSCPPDPSFPSCSRSREGVLLTLGPTMIPVSPFETRNTVRTFVDVPRISAFRRARIADERLVGERTWKNEEGPDHKGCGRPDFTGQTCPRQLSNF